MGGIEMTQDEIVKMAREAGLVRTGDKWVEPARWGVTELVHFANLVAAAAAAAARAEENEACAQLCDRFANRMMSAEECAAAIRARGNT